MTSPRDEPALVDTNVLVYTTDRRSGFHSRAKSVVEAGLRGELKLVVTSQILLEYVRVLTHPKLSATPLEMPRAWDEALKFKAAFDCLSAPPDLVERMAAFEAHVHARSGEVFDLCHAATALAAGVRAVYTFDPSVFARIPGFTVRSL